MAGMGVGVGGSGRGAGWVLGPKLKQEHSSGWITLNSKNEVETEKVGLTMRTTSG